MFAYSPSTTPTLRLPVEILRYIIDLASTPSASADLLPLDHTSIQPRVHAKPDFNILRGLSGSSRAMRTEVLSAWFRALYIREPADWNKTIQMGLCDYVL